MYVTFPKDVKICDCHLFYGSVPSQNLPGGGDRR